MKNNVSKNEPCKFQNIPKFNSKHFSPFGLTDLRTDNSRTQESRLTFQEILYVLGSLTMVMSLLIMVPICVVDLLNFCSSISAVGLKATLITILGGSNPIGLGAFIIFVLYYAGLCLKTGLRKGERNAVYGLAMTISLALLIIIYCFGRKIGGGAQNGLMLSFMGIIAVPPLVDSYLNFEKYL